MTNPAQLLMSVLNRILRKMFFALAVFCTLTSVGLHCAQAQTFTVLHTFTGTDGAYPQAAPILDSLGNLYGTTSLGGAHDEGLVYQLAHVNGSWILHPLYSFTGYNDGGQPYAGVTLGPHGTPFGATSAFGSGGDGFGTLFNLQPPAHACTTVLCPWTDTTLYTFTGTGDGGEPEGNVAFDSQGNLYGTAFEGGAYGVGTVYKATLSGGTWVVSTIHSFAGPTLDGGSPVAGLVLDSAGNLYGTTPDGGMYGPPLYPPGYGTVFELSPSQGGWTETILYSFTGGSDGCSPIAGLAFDHAGNLYGATSACGDGTIFELSPRGGGWNFTTIYTLPANGPASTLAIDSAGNLYGTSPDSGPYRCHSGNSGCGNVFKLSPSGGGWTYTDLHDFTGANDGWFPNGVAITGPDGYLYGTTYYGGNGQGYGEGVIYQINLGVH